MDILIAKRLHFNDIGIIISSYEFNFDPSVQKEIDNLRAKKINEAQEKGQKLWDGLNYFLQGYRYNYKLTLSLGTVKFRNISMGNFLSEELKEKTKINQPKGVFVAGLIRTMDNYFIFPKRSGKDVTKFISGEITTFGGVLQPDDKNIQTFNDIWDHMKTELREELGIKNKHILEGEFIGLTISKALNRGIIFYVNLNISHSDVLSAFRKGNDGEMSEILCIPHDKVYNFLTKEGFDSQGNYNNNLGLYRDIMSNTMII